MSASWSWYVEPYVEIINTVRGVLNTRCYQDNIVSSALIIPTRNHSHCRRPCMSCPEVFHHSRYALDNSRDNTLLSLQWNVLLVKNLKIRFHHTHITTLAPFHLLLHYFITGIVDAFS